MGFYWDFYISIFHDFTWFYWVSMGFIGFHWVFLGFIGVYLVLLGFYRVWVKFALNLPVAVVAAAAAAEWAVPWGCSGSAAPATIWPRPPAAERTKKKERKQKSFVENIHIVSYQ